MDQPEPHTITAGVAVPIPDPWGCQLQQARTGFGDHRAARIPTHITLLPPTAMPFEALPELRAHLREVAGHQPAFPVVLRGTGTFRPVSDVVFVQVAQGIAECEILERRVRSGRVATESVFPYHPHVTVAQDIGRAALDRAFTELADFSCAFEADVVRLYTHTGDQQWRRDADFALADSAAS
ncbi:MAG: 2'-5' RNA ligase family protein [Ornithinimicrobium sp.]|uniref:2'-5' RNA ligase family protein n=1 Tax=Ornithinimicrobium sp. TaxID=1977084 RepID=UPI003D9AE017